MKNYEKLNHDFSKPINEIEKNKNKKFSLKKFNIFIKNIIKLTIKKLGLDPIFLLYYRFK